MLFSSSPILFHSSHVAHSAVVPRKNGFEMLRHAVSRDNTSCLLSLLDFALMPSLSTLEIGLCVWIVGRLLVEDTELKTEKNPASAVRNFFLMEME